MPSPLVQAILDAGLVPPNVQREQSRWNPDIPAPQADTTPTVLPLAEAAAAITAARAADEISRETDRELPALFANPEKVKEGVLVLVTPERSVELSVRYVHKLADVVFEWTARVDLAEILRFTEKSHLRTADGVDIYFVNAEDRYVGRDVKYVVAEVDTQPTGIEP